MTVQEEVDRWKREGAELLRKTEEELNGKRAQIELLTTEVEALEATLVQMRSMLPAPTEKQTPPRTSTVSSWRPAAREARAVPTKPEPKLRRIDIDDDASLSDVVRAVLRATDEPMSAADILEAVSGLRTVKAEEIHKTIYRLKDAEQIEVTGERPNRLYSLKEAQTAIQMAK